MAARTQVIDAMLGLALCVIALSRLFFGSLADGQPGAVMAVAVLAFVSLAGRHRWPLPALTVATVGGIVAVPVDLRDSPIDALLGLGLVALTLGRLVLTPRAGSRWRQLPVVAAAGRRSWPWPLAIIAVAAGIAVAPVDLKEAAGIAILLTAYVVGAETNRPTALVAGGATAIALAIGASLVATDSWTGPDTPVPLIAAALVGTALGDAVRSRRELAVAAKQREQRTRQAIDEEARRRVVEERLRIAREVHDLVAHHMAVANVQAGVASYLLSERPEAALAALGHVRTASRTALSELGTLLGVLREPADPAAPTEPTPGLADLPRLLDTVIATGLCVDLTASGTPRPLPATADLAAYRIVQESLTNAGKHGRGRAQLTLNYAPDALHIEVRNTSNDAAGLRQDIGVGHGLRGMRERVAVVGGTLEAGPVASGEFVVKARLLVGSDGVGANA